MKQNKHAYIHNHANIQTKPQTITTQTDTAEELGLVFIALLMEPAPKRFKPHSSQHSSADCKECKEPRFFPPAAALERRGPLLGSVEFRKLIGGFIDNGIFSSPVDEEFKCMICLDVLLEARSCQVRRLSSCKELILNDHNTCIPVYP